MVLQNRYFQNLGKLSVRHHFDFFSDKVPGVQSVGCNNVYIRMPMPIPKYGHQDF